MSGEFYTIRYQQDSASSGTGQNHHSEESVSDDNETPRFPVTPDALAMADLLEKPSDPDRPAYDTQLYPTFSDVVMRVRRGGRVSNVPFEVFSQGVDNAKLYINATEVYKDVTAAREEAAEVLTGIADTYPDFGGFGFPDAGASATVVRQHPKTIDPDRIDEVLRDGGNELEGAVEHLIIDFIIPRGRTSINGFPLNARNLLVTIENGLYRNYRKADRPAKKVMHVLEKVPWKRVADLIRRGRIDYTAFSVTPKNVVKPIPLSPVPEKLVDLSGNSPEE